jgi:hypothetical protein
MPQVVDLCDRSFKAVTCYKRLLDTMVLNMQLLLYTNLTGDRSTSKQNDAAHEAVFRGPTGRDGQQNSS